MANQADLRVNRLLSLLPPNELARIAPALSVVDSQRHQLIYGIGAAVDYGYFPLTAVMSLLATDAHGRAIEAASVGREGLVGLPGALGGGGMVGEVITQVSGRVARIEIGTLRSEIERRETLSIVVERYTVALLSSLSQSLMCNRHHSLESRAARWLLATGDRVGEDDFVLTQDFLGVMLGVARPQVSLAEGVLKRAGLIRYARGHVTILDRPALEATVCECYGIIEHEYERLLRPSNGNGPGTVAGDDGDGPSRHDANQPIAVASPIEDADFDGLPKTQRTPTPAAVVRASGGSIVDPTPYGVTDAVLDQSSRGVLETADEIGALQRLKRSTAGSPADARRLAAQIEEKALEAWDHARAERAGGRHASPIGRERGDPANWTRHIVATVTPE